MDLEQGDVPMIRTTPILAGAAAQAQAPSSPSASTDDIDALLCRVAQICPDDNGVLNAD